MFLVSGLIDICMDKCTSSMQASCAILTLTKETMNTNTE